MRKGSLLRFQLNSITTSDGCAQKLWSNLWHDFWINSNLHHGAAVPCTSTDVSSGEGVNIAMGAVADYHVIIIASLSHHSYIIFFVITRSTMPVGHNSDQCVKAKLFWGKPETAAEDAAVLPSLTQGQPCWARCVLFVRSVLRVYGVAAVWVSFTSMFVFPDSCVYCQSASSVCVSPRQQWPSHCAVQQVQVVSR